MPSGSANPYLIAAGHIAAGIDGLNNKLEPTNMHDENVPELATSLEQALKALEADSVIVEALGQEFIQWFCMIKREFEVSHYPEFDRKCEDEEVYDKEWQQYARLI